MRPLLALLVFAVLAAAGEVRVQPAVQQHGGRLIAVRITRTNGYVPRIIDIAWCARAGEHQKPPRVHIDRYSGLIACMGRNVFSRHFHPGSERGVAYDQTEAIVYIDAAAVGGANDGRKAYIVVSARVGTEIVVNRVRLDGAHARSSLPIAPHPNPLLPLLAKGPSWNGTLHWWGAGAIALCAIACLALALMVLGKRSKSKAKAKPYRVQTVAYEFDGDDDWEVLEELGAGAEPAFRENLIRQHQA